MNHEEREPIEVRYDKEADQFVAFLKSKWGPVVTGRTVADGIERLKKSMPMACVIQGISSGKFRMVVDLDERDGDYGAFVLMTKTPE